jgi:hypothetical protein
MGVFIINSLKKKKTKKHEIKKDKNILIFK